MCVKCEWGVPRREHVGVRVDCAESVLCRERGELPRGFAGIQHKRVPIPRYAFVLSYDLNMGSN